MGESRGRLERGFEGFGWQQLDIDTAQSERFSWQQADFLHLDAFGESTISGAKVFYRCGAILHLDLRVETGYGGINDDEIIARISSKAICSWDQGYFLALWRTGSDGKAHIRAFLSEA